MTVRDRRLDRALALADLLTESSRREFRHARTASGLSRRDVARVAGMSPSQVDRFESGALQDIRLGQLCRASVAVGLVPSLRFFPDADPVRDAGQLRVLERLRERLPVGARFQAEVPLAGRNDQRAWDATIVSQTCRDAFEIETRLADVQAIHRRVMLKLRDDATVQHVFLVVPDTRWNRSALRAAREVLRGDFPLDVRASLAGFSRGHCPGANGIIVL